MDINAALKKIKEVVEKEKLQLDYILRGAELLADMLLANESGKDEGKKQYSEPGLAPEAGGEPGQQIPPVPG